MELPYDTTKSIETYLKNHHSTFLIIRDNDKSIIQLLLQQYSSKLRHEDNVNHIKKNLSENPLPYYHILMEVINTDSLLNRLKRDYDIDRNPNDMDDIYRITEEYRNRVNEFYHKPLNLSFKSCTYNLCDMIINKEITIKRLVDVADKAFVMLMSCGSDLDDDVTSQNHMMRLSTFVIVVIIRAYQLADDEVGIDQPLNLIHSIAVSLDDYIDTIEELYLSTLPPIDL